MSVAFSLPQYIYETYPVWRAWLSDDTIAVQNDFEGNIFSWEALSDYIKESKLKIRKLWVSYRDNHLHGILPTDADGYFFAKGMIGVWGASQVNHTYNVGHVNIEQGRVYVKKIKTPEMTLMEQDTRLIEKCSFGIICNHKE